MALAFLAGAAFLIAKASFVPQDGRRYFIIDDDALISLRYAWNFAHGHGLVWNEGERVEGFTDLLWVLYASVWAVFTPRRLLPLAMQISGVVLLLAQARMFMQIIRVMSAERGQTRPWMETAAFALPLAYYPLVFWSVQGMEVCLVGFLVALALFYYLSRRWIASAVVLGLAFWARPDTAIPTAAIMGMAGIDAFRDRRLLGPWLKSCGVLIGIVAVLFILRELYYGQLWPNTYVLKMRGFPVLDRITLNGIGYITPFLRENALPLGLALLALALEWTWRRTLFAAIVLPMIAYSVFVGGDALPHWRFIAPFAPFLGLILLDDDSRGKPWPLRFELRTVMVVAFFISWIVSSVHPFREMAHDKKRIEQSNIQTALELDRLLKPGASVGVLHAGSIPYYTDFRGVDFLGKCDPFIARLPPYFKGYDGRLSWGGMTSVPGHNKYDLLYSIEANKPTFIQSHWWAGDNASEYVRKHYVMVSIPFYTHYTDNGLWLRRDSPYVRWELTAADSNRVTVAQ